MRCLVCEQYSFLHICKNCQDEFLKPDPIIRNLDNNLKVVSFFSYDEIDFLLKTKHNFLGHYIYKIIASKSMKLFSKAFKFDDYLDIVPIDDKTTHGYSHTAILAKALKSKKLHPKYRSLHSQNSISYSGKDLEFRKSHPRNFKLLRKSLNSVILVDDIVTTGTTLYQATKLLKKNNIKTIMAIVLADANR